MEENKVISKETCKKAIESIGQDLIKRAEEITNDLKFVRSITIKAELSPCEIVNYDVTKNYWVLFNKED
jgi:hypothetical protein